MNTTLLMVGRMADKRISAMVGEYAERLRHYMPFAMKELPELKSRASLTPLQQKELEGASILKQLSPQENLVLFDEHGSEFTSIELASWLEKQQQAGRPLVLLIGGPYGFSDAVYKRADARLSLSRLTMSHQMVRLFAVEQLYRACTILRGEKYHHE